MTTPPCVFQYEQARKLRAEPSLLWCVVNLYLGEHEVGEKNAVLCLRVRIVQQFDINTNQTNEGHRGVGVRASPPTDVVILALRYRLQTIIRPKDTVYQYHGQRA